MQITKLLYYIEVLTFEELYRQKTFTLSNTNLYTKKILTGCNYCFVNFRKTLVPFFDVKTAV